MASNVERPERTLYTFPISHYVEKARWCLDVKGLPYASKTLLPGVHAFTTRRIARSQTVPVLVDRGHVVADSTQIALYLEREYPRPPLLPSDPAQRERALALEEYFDEHAGPAVRAWVYGEMMTNRRGGAAQVFFSMYDSPAVALGGRVVAPAFEYLLRRRYRLDRVAIQNARAQAFVALDRLEREIESDPLRYLVGEGLTLADITAASLLGPLVSPPNSPWARITGLPSAVEEVRESLRRRPVGQWLLRRYELDRERRALA